VLARDAERLAEQARSVLTEEASEDDLALARRLLADQPRADKIYRAFFEGRPEDAFDGKELALLRYARKLTAQVADMVEADVAALRASGASDGEILEINQVCAYFNYSNRLLNGLGVTTKGDVLGLSPPNTDDLSEWKHV
jgi:alkylhydroperoxidase family enzyme